MTAVLRIFGCCLMLAAVPGCAPSSAERIPLFPKLRVGQLIRYQISYRATTDMHTDSSVAEPMAPNASQANAMFVLQVRVKDLRQEAGESLARLRTQVLPSGSSDLSASPSSSNSEEPNSTSKSVSPVITPEVVEFTLHSGGHVSDVQGLDKLSPGKRAAWQEWLARFGGGAALPQKTVKPGDKWKTDEPILGALLSGLSWEKDSEYVSDAPCSASKLMPQEACAVILTTATLKQKSNPKDATPEDYKLHDLRNSGTAIGKNQIISYFSLSTGLLVDATEDANQSMNVTVAKIDGSNQVHYNIEAESHSRVQLLSPVPAGKP